MPKTFTFWTLKSYIVWLDKDFCLLSRLRPTNGGGGGGWVYEAHLRSAYNHVISGYVQGKVQTSRFNSFHQNHPPTHPNQNIVRISKFVQEWQIPWGPFSMTWPFLKAIFVKLAPGIISVEEIWYAANGILYFITNGRLHWNEILRFYYKWLGTGGLPV